MKRILIIIVLIIAVVAIFWFRGLSRQTVQTSEFQLPQNFKLDMYSQDLYKPRVIAVDPAGHVLVSETSAGRVVALLDYNADGVAESKKILLTGLNKPHGLAFNINNDGKLYLYVAETDKVSRYEYGSVGVTIGPPVGVVNLPADGQHFTRTIAFGPKLRSQDLLTNSDIGRDKTDRLYIAVGSSCDACLEPTFKRASLLESDQDGTYLAQYARGLRNSVFFDFNPYTKQIWATEMGRDNLGDGLPPDEINIVEFNKDYGWPLCYGDRVLDAVYSPTPLATPTDRAIAHINPCSGTVAPHIELPAHSAPLGIAFIPVVQKGQSSVWPKEWQGNLLVALHGSERDPKVGYKIVRYVLDVKGNVVRSEDFMTGFLQNNKVKGRPVDIKVNSDGTIYISDDYAGAIYRLTYTP